MSQLWKELGKRVPQWLVDLTSHCLVDFHQGNASFFNTWILLDVLIFLSYFQSLELIQNNAPKRQKTMF